MHTNIYKLHGSIIVTDNASTDMHTYIHAAYDMILFFLAANAKTENLSKNRA